MAEPLTLYYNPRTRAATVRWMLEEVGAVYDLVMVNFEAGDPGHSQLLALNPMGKIPTLVLADGTVVTETTAILAHLADLYPEAGLAPAVGSSLRASHYRWLAFAGSCFEPALIMAFAAKEPVSVEPGRAGWGDWGRVIASLKTILSRQDYLTGERASAADIAIGAGLNWASMIGVPGLKDDPVLGPYITRMITRPAYQRAQALAQEG